jgi:sugar O-acyltransferase (sialic acid O-acetyltransferase NeuD family)
MNKDLIIIGAGGHARVVASAAIAMGKNIRGFLDEEYKNLTDENLPACLLGGVTEASIYAVNDQVEFVIGVGNNKMRQQIAEKYHELPWATVVHPFSFVDPSVCIGAGTVIFAGSVIQPGVVLGRHVVINTQASVDHDGVLEDLVQLAPGVNLSGNVFCREGVFLGTGVKVIQGLTIGSWSVVGAGAVVIRDLAASGVYAGVPARRLK